MNKPLDQPSLPRKIITISIPVLNEEGNIDRLLTRLDEVAQANPRYQFEFLFTDNASTDDTFGILAKRAANDRRIRVLRFSRNFGFQRSILTNYLNAKGEAAIQIDADLQDPPELIIEFLEKWEQGYKVVYGIRRRRIENPLLKVGRRLHYRLIHALSDVATPLDAGDFRLVDRVILDELAKQVDQAPYIRGMIASMGYPQIGIPYDRVARVTGRTKFNIRALVRLSIDAVCSQSTLPIQYITTFGFFTSLVSAVLACAYLSSYIMGYGSRVRGFTTLVLLMLVSMSVQTLFIGIIGEYVGRVYNNVRRGPLTIIADRIEPQSADDSSI
jgi:glycosyltransferase involved in cell wall biosynthesis